MMKCSGSCQAVQHLHDYDDVSDEDDEGGTMGGNAISIMMQLMMMMSVMIYHIVIDNDVVQVLLPSTSTFAR